MCLSSPQAVDFPEVPSQTFRSLSPGPPPAEGIDRSCTGSKRPVMGNPSGNKIFLAGPQFDCFALYAQGILSLDHNKIFIEVMDMLFRYAALGTLESYDLTSVYPVEHEALYSCTLLMRSDGIGLPSHEFRIFV